MISINQLLTQIERWQLLNGYQNKTISEIDEKKLAILFEWKMILKFEKLDVTTLS